MYAREDLRFDSESIRTCVIHESGACVGMCTTLLAPT